MAVSISRILFVLFSRLPTYALKLLLLLAVIWSFSSGTAGTTMMRESRAHTIHGHHDSRWLFQQSLPEDEPTFRIIITDGIHAAAHSLRSSGNGPAPLPGLAGHYCLHRLAAGSIANRKLRLPFVHLLPFKEQVLNALYPRHSFW